MRVISGALGGRLIRGPEGLGTRPITDRVKTNLFNILSPLMEDAVVADCFCGTGSLGIEALSRGGRFAAFAEIEGSALRLLQANLDDLQLADRSLIVRQDVLRKGVPDPPAGSRFSLVFLDPPYRLTITSAERLWQKLDEALVAERLADDVRIVWRHERGVTLAVPAELAGRLAIRDVREYGSQTLVFIAR
jgi:16S rRNA (guanine(966)-N(2))-methyltransferase RsmD